MKQILIVFVLVGCAWGNVIPTIEEQIYADFQPYLFENIILNMINKLKEKLKTEGMPEQNIPPLDPLILNNQRIQYIDDKLGINVDINATGSCVGLLGFEFNKFKLGLGAPGGGFKLQYDIEFPKISIDLNPYGLNLEMSKAVAFGDGKLKIDIEGLQVNGTGIVNLKNKLLYLKDISIELFLKAFSFKVTGFMHDEEQSADINAFVTEFVPNFLEEYHEPISNTLSEFLLKFTDGAGIPIG